MESSLSVPLSLSWRRLVLAYLAALATLMLADYLWLGTLMVGFYQSHLGALLLPQPRLGPALLFYLGYIGGLLHFAVLPGLARGGLRRVLRDAVLFGLIAYGTYDLSNFATLQVWTVDLVVADMVWGGFISAAAAALAWRVAGVTVHQAGRPRPTE